MNEDSGETPNPLNSNPDETSNIDALDANPAELTQEDSAPDDAGSAQSTQDHDAPEEHESAESDDAGEHDDKAEPNESSHEDHAPKEHRLTESSHENDFMDVDLIEEKPADDKNLIKSNFGAHDDNDSNQSYSSTMEDALGTTDSGEPKEEAHEEETHEEQTHSEQLSDRTNPEPPSNEGRISTGLSSDINNAGQAGNTAYNNPAAGAATTGGAAIIGSKSKQNGPTYINVSVDSLDPTGRSMQKTVEQAPEPKRSKKGLVFAIIGCLFFLLGIGAAVAAVMLSGEKPDPVGAAMRKIMDGDTPKYVAIDGDINLMLNDKSLPVKRINIDLDSDVAVGSMINTSSAVITLTDRTDNDYSARFDEIYAANGDLYFKLEGMKELFADTQVTDLLTGSFMLEETGEQEVLNCITDETGVTNCEPYEEVLIDCESEVPEDCLNAQQPTAVQQDVTAEEVFSIRDGITNMTIQLIEAADGVWLRIPTDDLHLTDGSNVLGSSALSCVTNLVSDVNKNSNSALELYGRYPFIDSTNEKIPISSKSKNDVYEVSLNVPNFTEYINAISNTDLARTLYSCMGWKNNASVTDSDVSKVVSAMPKTYVEIDDENNFTRLYFESDVNKGAANAIVDLGFSYPSVINVSEPVEYTDYSNFIQTLFSSMYNLEDQNAVVPEQQPVENAEAQPTE